jgi:tyrosyl-DNA phosphodiesterase 1
MILVTFKDVSLSDLPSSSKVKTDSKSKSPDPDLSATESSSDSEVEEINPERDATVAGWLYVGSHNFTPSAWGTLSGTSFTPVMNVSLHQ